MLGQNSPSVFRHGTHFSGTFLLICLAQMRRNAPEARRLLKRVCAPQVNVTSERACSAQNQTQQNEGTKEIND